MPALRPIRGVLGGRSSSMNERVEFLSYFELIDTLCGVTTKLADLVRAQQAILLQNGIQCAALEEGVKEAEEMLDLTEFKLRGSME